jgi:hypothetical protein
VRDNEDVRRRVLVFAAALSLAACGGGSSAPDKTQARDTRAPGSTGKSATPKTPADVPGAHAASRHAIDTIRAWTDQLRAGHIRKASSYFALPVIVSNSGPAIRLRTRPEVAFFNLSLPCGAKLVRTVAGARYTIATFRLVERRNSPAGCDGVGGLAATAFAFRHGKISEWRRVSVPPTGPAA